MGILGDGVTAGTLASEINKLTEQQSVAVARANQAQAQKTAANNASVNASATVGNETNISNPKPNQALPQLSDPPTPQYYSGMPSKQNLVQAPLAGGDAVPWLGATPKARVNDVDWVGNTFMLTHLTTNKTATNTSADDFMWMFYSTAMDKFTNTSIGGNIVINPLPKFCRFADPPYGKLTGMVDHLTKDTTIGGGMGVGYSEAFDDHNQRVYLRFGFPEYKGLVTFFTGFYDAESSMLGREGRLLPRAGYAIGKIVGTAVATVIAVGFIPVISGAIVGLTLFNMMMKRPSTRYYDIKSSMPVFWQRANLIAMELGANKRIFGRNAPETWSKTTDYQQATLDLGNKSDFNQNSLQEVSDLMGETLFSKDGAFDLLMVVRKAQRMKKIMEDEMDRIGSTATSPEDLRNKLDSFNRNFKYKQTGGEKIATVLARYYSSPFGIPIPDSMNNDPSREAMASKLSKVGLDTEVVAQNDPNAQETAANQATTNDTGSAPTSKEDALNKLNAAAQGYAQFDNITKPVLRQDPNDKEGTTRKVEAPGWWERFWPTVKAQVDGGGEWCCFRVDKIESLTESFTNNTGPSEIQSKINQTASSMQAARFSMSDFNTGFAAIDTAIDTIRSTIAGAASGFMLDGLIQLSGAGFVDIPDRYIDSSSDIGNTSFSMTLKAPYGNRLSQFFNIDVPIAMLLAAALPISHGNQSYGAPMLCEMYMPGKAVTRLGMITNLTINRGGDGNSWSNLGDCLSVDVQFQVKNLSTVVHAPITTALEKILPPWSGIFGEDNAYNDYLDVLGNMSLKELANPGLNVWLNLSKKSMALKARFGPASIAGWVGDTYPARVAAHIRRMTGGGSAAYYY